MERLKWIFLLTLITGVIFKLEQLPGASYMTMLAWLLGSIYCIYKIIKG